MPSIHRISPLRRTRSIFKVVFMMILVICILVVASVFSVYYRQQGKKGAKISVKYGLK